ncbi:MAG TPA: hypothetical protein VMB21_16600 [Candidatus Limnocylindria bacterium]|jgi:hypothetical protein|nr:hypothetical protein [Candidatus Limnocylindria bacterium]
MIVKLRTHPRRPKPHHIHGLSGLCTLVGILIGWRYLPPWMLHNTGIQIIVAAMILEKVLRVFFRG